MLLDRLQDFIVSCGGLLSGTNYIPKTDTKSVNVRKKAKRGHT
jgi:hypothetical protein